MVNKVKLGYLICAIGMFCLTTVGATYAYWAASDSSGNVIITNSTGYSISMRVNPLYHGFSLIPMDDENVVKAIGNKCKDKYDRGACSAYTIRVFDYNKNLNFVSGTIKVDTNIENLSYVIMAPKNGLEDESKCTSVAIEEETGEVLRDYCLYNDYNKFVNGQEQVLIESYDVTGIEEVKFILIVWLENEERSQNEDGVGYFNAAVTMSAGSGGKIQGLISDAIEIEAF